jgi:hypothetical protein
MSGAIMASGARPRSAVELLIERLAVRPLGRARLVRLPSRKAHQGVPEPQQGPTSFGNLHVLDTQQCQAAAVTVTASWTSASSTSILPICGRELGSQHGTSTPRLHWAKRAGAGLAGADARRGEAVPQALERMRAVGGRCENFLHSSELPDRGFIGRPAQGSVALRKSSSGSDRQTLDVTRSRMTTCAQLRKRLSTNHTREVLRKMTKEEAIALQTAVDEILALAVEKRSEIGGAVNWADLLCLDVEVSLLDDIVTVTVEGAAPEAVELCRFVSEELARRGYSGIAVKTAW